MGLFSTCKLNTDLKNTNVYTMLYDTGLFPKNPGDRLSYTIPQSIDVYKEITFLCKIGDSYKEIRVPRALSTVRFGESYYISDGYTGALDLTFEWNTKTVSIYLRNRAGFGWTDFGISQIFGVK